MLQDMDNNFPFGRSGGGGAPLRDENGKVITSRHPHEDGHYQRISRGTKRSNFNYDDEMLNRIPTDVLQNQFN